MPDQTTGLDRPQMRSGMPLSERQELRGWILQSALEQARKQAAEVYLSVRCRSHLPQRSPSLSEDQQRHEHTLCQAESAGNGCLCLWHDPEPEPVPEKPAGG